MGIIENEKKKLVNIYFLFFFIFPAAGNTKKNNNNEKKISGHNRFWATAQLYRKFFFYCNTVFVLQRERIEGCLYCNTIFCIVMEACVGKDLYCKRLDNMKLYCNTMFCIVAGRGGCWGGVSQYTRVYCDLRLV